MATRNYRQSSRRSSSLTMILGGLGLFALMSIGLVGTLWLAGVPLNPFGSSDPVEDPFMVRIPINAQPIPAYSRVDRRQMLNPRNGGLSYQKLPPQSAVGMSIVGVDQNGSHIESRVGSVKNVDDQVVFVTTDGADVRQVQTFSLGGAIMSINAILGRVVKADKRAGMGFQESTFFPKGTPEGLAGATPTGMRAITLDATRLTGVHSLGAGDLIDLLANVPTAESPASEPSTTEVQLLAQNAKVLRPVYVRNEVTQSASLMNGGSVTNVPKYEVAIAVDADDVIPLQNALNQALSITCVAHSMKPNEKGGNDLASGMADEVRVPVTVRPILAYQVVSRDAFVSPATRMLKTEKISRQEAQRLNVITSVSDALGAITRQDIPAGRYLRQSDLLKGPPAVKRKSSDDTLAWEHRPLTTDDTFASDLPDASEHFVSMLQQPQPTASAPSATAVGDRPAITTFIPAGRTAFAIPLERIFGAEHLQIGDSIDLLASYSLERLRDEKETETRPDGTVIVRESESLTPRKTLRTWEESFGNRAEPWFVASDAVVVAPVGFPAPAAALRAIRGIDGSQPSDKDITAPAVIIAVTNQEVESFATAMATRDAFFTVAFHAAEPTSTIPQQKRIAIAPEAISAFSKLSETSWKGNRRNITSRVVSISEPRFANALSLQDVESHYGRILKRDKTRGECFTADDFLPVGTSSGIAASARVGYTLLPIADREMEGVDAFESGDYVSILLRGVFKSSATEQLFGDAGVASSFVVAQPVKVARSSVAGQTILEIRNEDLTRLQAAIARSLTDRDALKNRSHLIAVGLERREDATSESDQDEITKFDPLEDIKTTHVFIGGQRSVKVFGGDGL